MKISLCIALLLCVCPLWAQEEDAPDCKDSPLIQRMPGSVLKSCDHKEFDEVHFSMAPDADGNAKEKVVEGDVSTWDYGTREGTGELQVIRNIQNALKQAGFTIDYVDSPVTLTAHKANVWYGLDNRGSYYDQTIVVQKAMEQEITASDLSDALNKSGRVAVYGINFDTAQATIQPGSDKVLQQIVQLMKDNPALKLRVEGHTDNVGAAAANQTLSQKRAQAVVAWLTAHGVAASRLTAQGFGATKPVGDNATEDGRAKNRRVELVKM